MESEDVLSTAHFTITLKPESLSVGRLVPGSLQGCAWPLLKAMFGFDEDTDADGGGGGFFSLTQEEDEMTLLMDERCRGAFDQASAVASIE